MQGFRQLAWRFVELLVGLQADDENQIDGEEGEAEHGPNRGMLEAAQGPIASLDHQSGMPAARRGPGGIF